MNGEAPPIGVLFQQALTEIERRIRLDTLEDVRSMLPNWMLLTWDDDGRGLRCRWPVALDVGVVPDPPMPDLLEHSGPG